MTCRGEIIPVCLLISLPVFCFITYGIAVSLGHVNASFPYISDTGTHPPESCVFGLLQGLYSFLAAVCVFIRFEQVRSVYKDSGRKVLLNTNTAGLVVGLISAFGVYVVANFQETNVLAAHLTGAALAFIGGGVYIWIQIAMSYRMREIPGYRAWMPHLRLVLGFIHVISDIAVIVAANIYADANDDVQKTTTTISPSSTVHILHHSGITPKTDPSSQDYSAHVASTAMEWVLALTSAMFFCTYAFEFRYFRVKFPQVHYQNSADINDMIHQYSNGALKDVAVIQA